LRSIAQPLNRSTAIVIFLAALALHLTYFFASDDYFYPDSTTYLVPSQNLAHGLGFVDELGKPETIRTPGYPLFLLLTRSAVPTVLLQHLLAALLAVAVFLVAERWSGSRATAIIAALLFSLDVPTIHYANKVLSETLFTVVFFAIFVAARSKRGFIATGLAAGALVLIRPIAILWFVVIALFIRPRRLAIAFTVSALLLPVAWGLRNRAKTGVFTIASIAGTNMLMYRAAGALAIMDDYDFPDALRDRQNELLEQGHELVERAEHVPDATELPHAVQAKYYGALGRRVFLQHPAGAVMITLRGMEMNLFDSDADAMMIVSRIPESIVRMSLDAFTHIECLLAIVGLFVMWRRDRALAAFVGLTLLYFVVISAGAESEARFRVPLMPLYAIAAAFAISGASTMRTPDGGRSTASTSERTTFESGTG
jgi:4-amino-4-deoxy-L-arabinose transferase and related glycosyltransferases of PMT family